MGGHRGYVKVIAGPMFSGKTTELIRNLERYIYAKRRVLVFKPDIDVRYSVDSVSTHSGLKIGSFPIPPTMEGLKEMQRKIEEENCDVVGVDEINFMPVELASLANRLADAEKVVILAGLNLDFRGEVFPTTLAAIAKADAVKILTAICAKCGSKATRTQRVIDGEPAPYNSPVVMVGGRNSYEARCRKCHVVPGAPP
ncbi:MAG: thymidine kinase [Thermoprotei archaeon]